MAKAQYGLMIDYDYCSGCHACEVACKKEHDLPSGDFGVKILQDGPRQNSNGSWEFDYLPVPTSLCDLCAQRTAIGKLPTCVHHCQAGVMVYGRLAELAAKATKAGKDKMVIFAK
jgi:Fe-S-cluster-containing dehydrogenase component